jgi:hypothetical protein
MARHLDWFMSCYEPRMSGMRINYCKPDLMIVNVSSSEADLFAQTFCRKIGRFLSNIWGCLSILLRWKRKTFNQGRAHSCADRAGRTGPQIFGAPNFLVFHYI